MPLMNKTNKRKQITHSPFVFTEDDGTEVSCSKDGKITIRQNFDGEEHDEVTISASTIFKTKNMLNNTIKVRYVDRDEK